MTEGSQWRAGLRSGDYTGRLDGERNAGGPEGDGSPTALLDARIARAFLQSQRCSLNLHAIDFVA